MTSDLLKRISAANYTEVRQDTADGPIFWRVRRISQAEAATSGVLEGVMSAGLDKIATPKLGRMAGASVNPTLAQAKAVLVMSDAVVKIAVCGLRGEDGEWLTIRLVDPEAEDIAAGRLSVASMSQIAMIEASTAAVSGAQEAAAAVAAFRGHAAEPADPS